MVRYLIRLDDACEKRDIAKWNLVEDILDKYQIKPIVGIIPKIADPNMDQYPIDETFWKRALGWQNKGWHIALHGFEHVFCTQEGGLNPVNNFSEFAGVSLEVQKEKIEEGIRILKGHGLAPNIFFAPAHTYDANTLLALKEVCDIRINSDTIAYDSYYFDEFTFIPQQSGKVRKLPFKLVTFCYHPNMMKDVDFTLLEDFINRNHKKFLNSEIVKSDRKRNMLDKILKYLYFARR